jgi:hypothetical protein
VSDDRKPVKQREALGRAERDGYLAGLSAALGRKVQAFDLLDLLTTDNLADEFADKLAACAAGDEPCVRETWPDAQRGRLAGRLAAVADTDPERPIILFRAGSDHCGAAVVGLAETLARAFALLDADGGRLQVGTKDMSAGLQLLSADAEAAGAPRVLELTVWGDDWLAAWAG